MSVFTIAIAIDHLELTEHLTDADLGLLLIESGVEWAKGKGRAHDHVGRAQTIWFGNVAIGSWRVTDHAEDEVSSTAGRFGNEWFNSLDLEQRNLLERLLVNAAGLWDKSGFVDMTDYSRAYLNGQVEMIREAVGYNDLGDEAREVIEAMIRERAL